MKRNSTPFSRQRRRGPMLRRRRRRTPAATTLIEVVAGLVILGTILASLAVARGRFARQWAVADRKLAATRALDGLVTGWMDADTPHVPLNRQGSISGSKMIWVTRAMADPVAVKLSAVIVRV